MNSKRILLTGPAGFIGNACGREFLRRGWGVTALVHRRAPQGLDGAELANGSLADRAALAVLLAERGPFHAVVNCAGLASDVARRSRLVRANCQAVLNIIECMPKDSPCRLVHISTSDVYGIRDFVDADESTPMEDNLGNAYARSKIMAEQAITAALPARRYVILRPGAVCGPGDTSILPRAIHYLRNTPCVIHFGRWRGANRWPLAHVRNVAVAAFLAAACDEALGQAYNVVDPRTITVEQYYRWVIRTFLPEKAALKSIAIPVPLAWPMAALGTFLSRALGRDHPLMDPSLYSLYCVAGNLDISSRKLQDLFTRNGETFVDSFQKAAVPG